MHKHQHLLYFTGIIFIVFFSLPFVATANYYTLPIDEPGDSDVSLYSWFDHDDSGEQKRYDGATSFEYDGHHGIDFSTNGKEEKDVYAAATGTVRAAGWDDPDPEIGYGYRIYLYHDESGQRTVYAHLSTTATTTSVSVNDVIGRGEIFASSGDTGHSSGPHLHFGVYECDCTATTTQVDPFGWWSSTSTDPWPYNENHYLWTTNPPSFNLYDTAPSTISSDTFWFGNILANGTVTVNFGKTLTTFPGTVVKFASASSNLAVNGILDAEGTENAPVYFTSYNDDTIGGDWADDGTSTSTAGDWEQIQLNGNGSTTLRHTIVRYGGNGYYESNIFNNGGTLNLFDATSTNSAGHGVRNHVATTSVSRVVLADNGSYGYYFWHGNATITDSIIQGNNYGIYADATGNLTLTDNSFSDNTNAAVHFTMTSGLTFTHSGNTATTSNPNGFEIAGSLGTSQTWTADDMPYVIDSGGFTVNGGKILEIDPGAIIKLDGTNADITISGVGSQFGAYGTEENPIYFTSIHDDTIGIDANDNGSASVADSGDWEYIKTISSASTTLRHAIVRYGGATSTSNIYSNIYTDFNGTTRLEYATSSNATKNAVRQSGTGSTLVSYSDFSNGRTGLYQNAGTLTISTSTIHDNSYGVYAEGSGAIVVSDTVFTDNSVVAADLLLGSGLSHTMTGNTSSGSPLNGTRIHGPQNDIIQTWEGDTMPYIIDGESYEVGVNEVLSLHPGAIIKFTDDSSGIKVAYANSYLLALGNSLNNIYFTSIYDDDIGGDTNGDEDYTSPAGGDWDELDFLYGASSTIKYAYVAYAGDPANATIYVNSTNSELTISTSTIASSAAYGIYKGSTGTVTIENSVIRDMPTEGASNVGTSGFTAINNYWNATSGPSHASNPDGEGVVITDYVDYDPWLGQLHYASTTDAVDDANSEMLWAWASTTESQTYTDELSSAITTWNALDPITISSTAGAPDVEVAEMDLPMFMWDGKYSTAYEPPLIRLNLDQIDSSIPVNAIQKTWTHELGHALGLDDSYWENVMYAERTTHISLGVQDMDDYHYLWGY